MTEVADMQEIAEKHRDVFANARAAVHGTSEHQTQPSAEPEAKPINVERAGNVFGNSLVSVGGFLQGASNVLDAVPEVGNIAAAVAEGTSTMLNVAGHLVNGDKQKALHAGIMGTTKLTVDLAETALPGSDWLDDGIGVVTGTTGSTAIGTGLADFLAGGVAPQEVQTGTNVAPLPLPTVNSGKTLEVNQR